MFVPHSNNNASSYHTYTEVKKNYMLKVSMTLGEFGPDIKEALEYESDLVLKQPTRKMITLPLGLDILTYCQDTLRNGDVNVS